MTLEDIKNLDYQGAGYFRQSIVNGKRVPKGKNAPIIHAPELVKLLVEMLEK